MFNKSLKEGIKQIKRINQALGSKNKNSRGRKPLISYKKPNSNNKKPTLPGYIMGHIKSFLGGSSQFIHVPNHGKRKLRYQKNGRAYVIVKGKKLKLN